MSIMTVIFTAWNCVNVHFIRLGVGNRIHCEMSNIKQRFHQALKPLRLFVSNRRVFRRNFRVKLTFQISNNRGKRGPVVVGDIYNEIVFRLFI